ncbi:putative ethanolamine kinase [Gossypium australe]|uniref:ethanolamine kinase n=1 Tax=Gossypium australe TaxID=47621 RepID=A0A5B6VH30_9ROSI|nr:putative ethanolamine kinase [Gossypium australe]
MLFGLISDYMLILVRQALYPCLFECLLMMGQELTDLFSGPVVFAHNDLLSGNLMLNDEQDKLYIIDFEYGSYNYRGFDIGNHFNEYAGYECDYSLYPSKEEQYHFLRHYLQPEKPYEVSEKDLEDLYVEANTFRLASHLIWALWGLIQARMSPIDFDYLGYFFWRYNEYKKQKEKCFSLAQSHLSGSRTV